MREVTVLAAACLLAAAAAPAAAQTQDGVMAFQTDPVTAVVTINNKSRYPVFTDTEAGSVNCLTPVVPPTTIPAGGSQTFQMVGNCTAAGGLQVFVPAYHGPEKRLGMTFFIPTQETQGYIPAGAGNELIRVSSQLVQRTKGHVGIVWNIDCPPGGCTAN
jgi:hypothetical protein